MPTGFFATCGLFTVHGEDMFTHPYDCERCRRRWNRDDRIRRAMQAFTLYVLRYGGRIYGRSIDGIC